LRNELKGWKVKCSAALQCGVSRRSRDPGVRRLDAALPCAKLASCTPRLDRQFGDVIPFTLSPPQAGEGSGFCEGSPGLGFDSSTFRRLNLFDASPLLQLLQPSRRFIQRRIGLAEAEAHLLRAIGRIRNNVTWPTRVEP
jgi:hypothetical protein